MKSQVAYLAEPIDQAGAVGSSEPAMIRRVLMEAGYIVYSPRFAWSMNEGVEPVPQVESGNRIILGACGLLVAYLPPGVPTVGVPREIEFAVRNHIPTIVVGQYTSQRFSLVDVARVDGAQALEGMLASDRKLEHLRRHTPPPYPDPKPAVERWLEAADEADAFLNPPPLHDWSNGAADTGDGDLIGYELRWVRAPRPAPLPPDVAQWESGATMRSYEGDAGFDLYVAEYTRVPRGTYARVPCGVRVAMPRGVFGWVVARSSTFRDHKLIVLPGVIDTGYRGELEAVVWSVGPQDVTLLAGDRIAQLILLPNLVQDTRLVKVDKLPDSERGSNGFGSSNRRALIYDDRGTD